MQDGVLLKKDEFRKIRDMYTTIMSVAAYGLLFRQGEIIAQEILRELGENPEFEEAARKIVERGWAKDVKFEDRRVEVTGSLEAGISPSGPACHVMRGIIRELYEGITGMLVSDVVEVECAANGHDKCVFEVELPEV